LPVKNEGVGIVSVIEQSLPYVHEILVVDGHSTDDTFEKASTMPVKVVKDTRTGKGGAIIMSLNMVEGDIVVFMDSDGSHEPSDIPRLCQPIIDDKADLVIASRITGGSDEFYMRLSHFLRLMGGCLATMATNYKFHVNLTDTGNGFRAIRRDVALKLNLKAQSFDIEQEMAIKALKRKYRLAEVASHEYERKWGEPKLRLYMGWRHLYNLFVNIILGLG
jgi:glycosyltransferase involved in cell wall biosynthesis